MQHLAHSVIAKAHVVELDGTVDLAEGTRAVRIAVLRAFEQDLLSAIEPGNGSQTTAQLISVGKYDIGFADSAPVMKLISQGAKIKVLATILQGNPNQVTALKKTGLKSVADMKGRSVAVPNGGCGLCVWRRRF